MGRRKQKPTPAELDKQADAILAASADRQMLEAILENTRAICDGFAEMQLPSNDPEYLKRLQASDAARSAIANKLTQVDIVADGTKTYLGVGWFNNPGEARDVAERLANHFELRIRNHGAE